MRKYRVIVLPTVKAIIRSLIVMIATERHAPTAAQRLLSKIKQALVELKTFPHIGPRPPEDDFRPYLIRCRIIGKYLLLYTVNDEKRKVHVIGFRHGAQEPRPGLLPPEAPN
jgi:plasmid stabilization system protein ParE